MPAFTCYELAGALGVLATFASPGSTSPRTRIPGIVLISAQTAARRTGPDLIAALRSVIDRAPGPVSLMLDHAKDADVVAASFAAGVDSVLADGSHLAWAANLAFTREVSAIARSYGGSVEAELGAIPGDEDRRDDVGEVRKHLSRGDMGAPEWTSPTRLSEFVEATGCDAVAVSVGNRHGGAPDGDLDWVRLERLIEQSPVPVAMHGASGLTSEQVQRCVDLGVAKLNFNTQLRHALFGALNRTLHSDAGRLDLDRLVHAGIEAVADESAALAAACHP